jgi:hypothetical protein
MKKLFPDDIRTVETVYSKENVKDFDIVRSYDAFIDYIRKNGLPAFISFDNDLGLDEHGEVAPDGYAASRRLVYESGAALRNLRLRYIPLILSLQNR